MKKIITTIALGLTLMSMSHGASAQMMQTGVAEDTHTAREEAEGKIVWEKLQAKQLNCTDAKADDFGVLGEYFMGQMMGTSHESMNAMMTQMMGKEGEEEMHVILGKRLSGCDPSAAFSAQATGFLPMMNMMTGGRSISPGFGRYGGSMMNKNAFHFSGIFILFFLVLSMMFLVAFAVRVSKQSQKTSLELLKERYARGEIQKKEFEEMKKDLV